MVAGVATIAFSLVVSIAPAMAAKGGNSRRQQRQWQRGRRQDPRCDHRPGGRRARERALGLRLLGRLLRLQPDRGRNLADPELAADRRRQRRCLGHLRHAGDGVDATGDLALADGHYRLEWQTDGDNNTKHKTFWVECEGSESNPEDETPGDETPGDETPGDETPGDETPGDETSPDEEVESGEESNNPPPADEDPDATDDGDRRRRRRPGRQPRSCGLASGVRWRCRTGSQRRRRGAPRHLTSHSAERRSRDDRRPADHRRSHGHQASAVTAHRVSHRALIRFRCPPPPPALLRRGRPLSVRLRRRSMRRALASATARPRSPRSGTARWPGASGTAYGRGRGAGPASTPGRPGNGRARWPRSGG